MRVAENCHRLSREVMESPYPCRYSKAAWTWSCAPGSRWPCLSRRIGPDDLQRCLPLSTTLWFCDKCSQGCSPTSSVYMIFKYFALLHFLHVCEVNCTGPANPAQFPHSTSLTLYSLNRNKLLIFYFITWSWSVSLVSKCQKLLDFTGLPLTRASGTNLLLKHDALTMILFHNKRYAHSLPSLCSDTTRH